MTSGVNEGSTLTSITRPFGELNTTKTLDGKEKAIPVPTHWSSRLTSGKFTLPVAIPRKTLDGIKCDI